MRNDSSPPRPGETADSYCARFIADLDATYTEEPECALHPGQPLADCDQCDEDATVR